MSLAEEPKFEQPEVPELPESAEAEILAGSEEDYNPVTAALPSKEERQLDALTTLAESVKLLVARQESTRQLNYNEILPTSPWNPEGKRQRTQLRRQAYQNGIWLNPMMLRESEIELLNAIKPGRYLNRTVEVQLWGDGSVNISYKNGKLEKRMEFAAKYPDLTALLNALIKDRELKEARRKAGVFEVEEYIG